MDIDKIISAYECVITRGKSVCECGKCDYHINDSAVFFCDNQRVLTDTLSLLKEQEKQIKDKEQQIALMRNTLAINNDQIDKIISHRLYCQFCGECVDIKIILKGKKI